MLPDKDTLIEEAWRVEVRADTGCLRLTSLSFDLTFSMCTAIDSWTACVTRRSYVLDQDLLRPIW